MHSGIHAKSNPDKAAYIVAATGRVITYRELDDESNRAANLLRSLGLKPGDTIALLAENHHRYHQVLWAAQRSGLYYTAIRSRLTAEEAAYIAWLWRARRVRPQDPIDKPIKIGVSSCLLGKLVRFDGTISWPIR
jgi:acyl-CoA synthetase (AMP-forming)/AMP-acid ligase II